MAMPTISSNSPSAGYITWTAFNITFAGVSYSVASSNTNKKFTWWEYNGGAPILQTSDTLPTLAPEDILLFLNKNGVGALVPMTDVVDGSLIVTGSILAPAIAADQIQTYHLDAGVVTANEIAANVIGATHIQAGAITTDKLSVGTVSESLVTNSSFEDFANGMPLGWGGAVTGGTGSVDIVTGVASSGANAARLIVSQTTSSVSLSQSLTKAIPVTSNAARKYYIGATIGAGTATTNGLYLRALWYDANKAYISLSEAITGNSPVTGTFARFEGQVTPPSTARYMVVEVKMVTPNVTTTVYVDEVVAYEVTISAQIGDGAITTPKLVANAVTANELAAGSVNAKHMIISDFENLVMDPLLTRPLVTTYAAGDPWSRRSGAAGASTIVSTAGLPGNAFKLDGVSTEVSVQGDFFEVQGLQEYFVSCKAQQTLTGSSPLGYMRIDWFLKDKVTATGSQFSMTIPAQGWGALGTTAIAPVDAYYGRMHFIHGVGNTGGSWWVGNPQIRRMNGGELIVDGEITASKLSANSVTASKILAGTIATSHMTANTINADRLAVNTITGDRIAANTITASKLAVGDFENLATINEITGVTIATNGQTQIVGGYNTKVNDADSFFMFKERTPGVPFLPGEQILVKFTAKATTTPASVTPTIWVYDAAGANTATASAAQTVNATDTNISVIITPTTPTNPSKEWVIGMSGFAGKGIGIKNVVVRRMNAGELIVDGAITTNKMTANSINGDRILANTLSADKITANSISTDKLAISDFTNYLPGGNFDTSMNMANWTLGTGLSLVTTGQYAGTGCLQAAAGAGTRSATPKDPNLAVVPGDKYYLSYWVKTSSDYNGTGGNGKLRVGDQTGALITALTHAAPTQTTWAQRSAVITIPAGINGLQCSISFDHTVGTCWIDSVQLRRMHAGELIVDGAISTNHMTANSINADRLTANTIAAGKLMANSVVAGNILAGEIGTNHLAANAVTAGKILAGEIGTGHLAANAITAGKLDANAINGMTITGATIQTSASNPRIVMDATKFEGYDASGNRYIKMDEDGLEQTGVFNTLLADKATSFQIGVPEAVLTGNGPTGTVGGVPGFAFIQGSRSYADSPRLFSYSNGLSLDLRGGGTDYNEGILQVSSGGVYAISGDGSFELGAARAFLKYDDNNYMSFTPGNGLSVTTENFKVNAKRIPTGLLSLQRHTGVTTVTTTDSQLGSTTVAVTPGMVLEISGSYAGGPSGASAGQYISWAWKANGVRFAENSHRSNTNGFGEGDSFSGFYTVPAGQTSVTISLWGVITVSGGTYVCPADSTSPKLQWAVKDIGDV